MKYLQRWLILILLIMVLLLLLVTIPVAITVCVPSRRNVVGGRRTVADGASVPRGGRTARHWQHVEV